MGIERAFMEFGRELWRGWATAGALLGLYEWQRLPQEVWVSMEGDDERGKGQPANPFRTVQHAIDAIVDKGDNSMQKPYVVRVAPGFYDENLVLDSPKLRNIGIKGAMLDSAAKVRINKISVTGHDTFKSLYVEGIEVNDISVIGKNDQSTCFTHDCEFRNCYINNSIVAKNTSCFGLYDGKFRGSAEIENVPWCWMMYGSGYYAQPFTISWRDDRPKPKDANAGYNLFICAAIIRVPELFGRQTIQLRQGTRFGQTEDILILDEGQSLINYCSCCLCKIDTGGNPDRYIGYGGYHGEIF